jgi:hypothetical protein
MIGKRATDRQIAKWLDSRGVDYGIRVKLADVYTLPTGPKVRVVDASAPTCWGGGDGVMRLEFERSE